MFGQIMMHIPGKNNIWTRTAFQRSFIRVHRQRGQKQHQLQYLDLEIPALQFFGNLIQLRKDMFYPRSGTSNKERPVGTEFVSKFMRRYSYISKKTG